MDREEIKRLLPHREPMLLLDTVDTEDDGTCRATYRIPDDAFFCQGHFPGNPIVPGVILCEIMAQACLCILGDEAAGHLAVYRSIDGVKFRSAVRPGDLCEITGKILERKAGLFLCEASVAVSGRRCCAGTLSFALVNLS